MYTCENWLADLRSKAGPLSRPASPAQKYPTAGGEVQSAGGRLRSEAELIVAAGYSAASVSGSAFRDRIRANAVSTCLLNTYSAGR